VISFLTSTGLKPKRTSIQSPWQNGTAERWIGSCRREMLDHVIAINERHLLRLLHDYVGYYHHDRIHDALKKDTPTGRSVRPKPGASGMVIRRPDWEVSIIDTTGRQQRSRCDYSVLSTHNIRLHRITAAQFTSEDYQVSRHRIEEQVITSPPAVVDIDF
jgi:hypothetical protein